MLVIPFELPKAEAIRLGRGSLILFLVLEEENIARMRQADPADLKLADYSNHLPSRTLVTSLDIVIAFEEDISKLFAFKKNDDMPGLIDWLERGRKIIPGDVTPPVPYQGKE